MKQFNEEENRTLLVFSKEVNDNNRKFTTYYGYRQTLLPDGTYEDVATPATDEEGKATMITKSIKIKFNEDFLNTHKDLTFPVYMTINKTLKLSDGRDSSFITVDKDSDKKPRLDKNGHRHLVLVVRDVVSITEAPRTSYSLDDLDDFQ